MKVYLGGPIFGRTDVECKDWRTEARRLLAGHEVIDPMDRDYRGKEDENVEDIVNGDKLAIWGCDVLLMNCTTPSVGTSMEVFFGWLLGKRVLVVERSGHPSPWLRHHSHAVFGTVQAAVESIL